MRKSLFNVYSEIKLTYTQMNYVCCFNNKSTLASDIQNLSPEWDLRVTSMFGPNLFMTALEIEMIAQRWNYLTQFGKDKEFGYTFFEKFFLYAPDTLKLFFSEDEGDMRKRHGWQRHPLFISHIRRVMNGIDMSIILLDHADEFETHMKQLISFHKQFQEIRKVHVEIFVKTLEHVVATMLRKLYTRDHKKAFRKFFTKLYLAFTRDFLE